MIFDPLIFDQAIFDTGVIEVPVPVTPSPWTVIMRKKGSASPWIVRNRTSTAQVPQPLPPAPPVEDLTPDAFAFTPQAGVALSSERTSNAIQVAGITAGRSVPISITGGSYSKNGGPFTAASGLAVLGDSIAVRHTSSASNLSAATTTLTIGGVSATFTSTTATAIVEPPAPVNTAVPTISDPRVGEATTSTTGSWNNGPITVYTYQWKVDGANVGANNPSYTPVSSDEGKQLTLTVGARNAASTTFTSATSASRVVRPVVAVPPPPAETTLYQPLGFNLALGHAEMSPGRTTPLLGVHGTNYFYPQDDEIDMLAQVGTKDVRIGFVNSRVAATHNGGYNPEIASILIPGIDRCLAHGMRVHLEDHSYARLRGEVLTVAKVPELIYIWNAFAKYKNNPNVIPAMQNEPEALTPAALLAVSQAWINAMRDDLWTQKLIVPSAYYSGLPQLSDDEVKILKDLTDPLTPGNKSKLLFDVHYYFDISPPNGEDYQPYYSGPGQSSPVWTITDADVASGAHVAKFQQVLNAWDRTVVFARANGMKLWIGETAVPFTVPGNAVRPLLLEYMKNNADVIEAVTYWVAGEFYNPEDFTVALTASGGQAVMTDLGMRIVNDRRAKLGLAAMAKPAPGSPFPPPA